MWPGQANVRRSSLCRHAAASRLAGTDVLWSHGGGGGYAVCRDDMHTSRWQKELQGGTLLWLLWVGCQAARCTTRPQDFLLLFICAVSNKGPHQLMMLKQVI